MHTPEFAFEHDPFNVSRRDGAARLRYPVALDNDYGDLEGVRQPVLACEVPDRPEGHVRFVHFGEGEYDETETRSGTLLARAGTGPQLGRGVADRTPHDADTRESYLGC